jgi:hypothetical protein
LIDLYVLGGGSMRSRQIFSAALSVVVFVWAFCASIYATGPSLLKVEIVPTPTDGGIKEDVPTKFRGRFERWKSELMQTAAGREQWERYANNRQFVLTIKISSSKGKGGGTDKYLWDDEGRFVGATITLGSDIDNGYPAPIYYPVLNSLSGEQAINPVSGNILAAAKISHELGHVIQTEESNVSQLQVQSNLIPKYTSIFLSNGHDVKDVRLVELAGKIGGTPMEIWESREYWSEVNAMRFLEERIRDENFYCRVFNRIRQNVETYAQTYAKRFEPDDAQCKR